MKKFLVALAASVAVSLPAYASTVDNTSLLNPPGVYFGTGNGGTNDHWTVDTQGAIELGLIAIERGVGNTYVPTGNVYHVPLGADPSNAARAVWNFDLSVNLQATGLNLNGLTLGDVVPNLSVHDVLHNSTIAFNPLTTFGDNSAYAANGTTRNGNVSGQEATGADIGFQNSENLTFFPWSAGLPFNMNTNDTYQFVLSLSDNAGNSLGSTEIEVIAGNGVATTPLPAALPLMFSALGGGGLLLWRRKKKAGAAGALPATA